jgi:hydroxymethylpyrimidine kinase/phosphomethylpyrimidine kinase
MISPCHVLHTHVIPNAHTTITDTNRGAGIQADLKTFTSLETFGTSVITSVTSQNTVAVDGIHAIPAAFVAQQLEAVLSDIGTNAIKTGNFSSNLWGDFFVCVINFDTMWRLRKPYIKKN